jgi:hypothetical protein
MTQAFTSPLATPAEAQAYLRLSRKSFDRHVRRHLIQIRQGGRVFYEWKEIQKWLENQKAGPYVKTHGPATTPSASGTRVSESTDPRVAKMLGKLKSKRRESTPRLFPVGVPRK